MCEIILTFLVIFNSLRQVLEQAGELIVDTPLLYKYLGEIISPVLPVIGLSFLRDAVELLRNLQFDTGRAFIAGVLQDAHEHMVGY